jgi:hypothetical protein
MTRGYAPDDQSRSDLAAEHAFTIRVEGDKFHLKGSLKDGLHIEEVWERVK